MKYILFVLLFYVTAGYAQNSEKFTLEGDAKEGRDYSSLLLPGDSFSQRILPDGFAIIGRKDTTNEYIYEEAPCPDGIPGCCVYHVRRVKNPNFPGYVKDVKRTTPAIAVGEGLKLDTLADGTLKISIADGYFLLKVANQPVLPQNIPYRGVNAN